MAEPGWLSQREADVAAGEDWLGKAERRTLATLRTPPRRVAWRLGRWTAKVTLAAWLGVPPYRFEVLAAADGAPEAWLDGERVPVSISLSHRAGRALAVVADAPDVLGCDLEILEPRSGAFVREWLAPAEQGLVTTAAETERPLLANLLWTAKEAAAKVRRDGLRLDVRTAVVALTKDDAAPGMWRQLRVDWEGGASATHGWWRAEPGWVMTIAGRPAPNRPRALPVGSLGLGQE